MPMKTRKNRRGRPEYYVSGRHLNLNDLKQEARHLGNQYLIKENIPTSPKPEFHVAHLKHDTGPDGLEGIMEDGGFRDPHQGVLLWWSLAVDPKEVKSAETRLLQQSFSDLTEDQAAMHPSFLYKFTTSPAFSETSRLGSYRFTFPLEEVLDAYQQQFCSGDRPVMRVYETVLHRQEVQHVVLVHSPANDDLFSEFPLLTDDPNAICVYKDGRFIWRPYAMSETHKYELIRRPERNQMDAQELYGTDVQFYIWDNVAIALHVDKQVLKFDAVQLRKNLKFCDQGYPAFGTFHIVKDAKNQVKDLWPDYDSPLEKTCSLDEHFKVPDLRLVLVGRTGSGKSSIGNLILGRDAFSTGAAAAGNAQCCLQTAKVFNRRVTIIDTPGLSETPEVKTEIWRYVNMSAPGPHAFLLVYKVGTPIDEDAVRQMKVIFGEDVWRHTFVVLNSDNQLEEDDEIVDVTNSKLQEILPWSVEDRFYVLNNKQQVWDLLDSVAERVVKTRGNVYSFNRRVINDLRLVLVGRTGSGKSSIGNIILRRDAFSAGGAAASPSSGNAQTAKVFNRKVTIIDTPGLSETPEVKTEIWRCVDMLAPGPHAFLLVYKVGTPIDEDAVRQMEEIFGEDVWRHTFVVFTYDDQLGTYFEYQELLAKAKLKKILPEIVGDRFYNLNINPKSSDYVYQDCHLLNMVQEMVVENGKKFYSVQNRARKRKITDVEDED